jgi:transposase-like protein
MAETPTPGRRQPREKHSPEVVERALALAAEKGPLAAAEELGLHASTIYAWRKRTKAGARGATVLTSLPTTRILSGKPRPLVPVVFKCPHCGGTVLLPEGANHG